MKTLAAWILLALALASPLSLAQIEEDDGRFWFTTDELNAGLGQAPDEVRRVTPREAVRSFMALTEEGEFAKAAHLLNLSDLTPEEQAERGGELARQLSEVLRRGEWLNVSNLPARRDALVEDATGQHPRAGQPRRNLPLVSLDARGETYDIRLGRYRVGEDEAVWLITPESISAVGLLYEEYGPSWLEQHIPDRFNTTYGMLKLWEWVAIPLFLVVIGLLGWGVFVMVGVVSRWLPGGMPRSFTANVRVPLAFIAMSLMAQILLDYVVSFSGAATASFRVLLIVILAWGLGLVALRLVDTFLLRMTRRLVGEIDDSKHRDERKLLTSLYALRRGIILVTVIAVTVYILAQIELFGTLGLSLLASASVLTVLVGIAGQAVLGNILSSFQVSLAKPVRIGDLVVFEDEWCYVEGIFYTFIRLRTWDERRVIVPVRYFVSQPFQNLSAKEAKQYRRLVLHLHLSADIGCLRERFQAFAREDEGVIEHDQLACFVTGQTETSLEVSFYLMGSEPICAWEAEARIREKLVAYIRDHHPEWWPREVVVLSHHDVARGARPAARTVTRPARVEDITDREP
ncbi:small-conductance mechanosensitive channel [Halomonas campaniensis]|uniref:Small-conductance mechanosensitive channel n=1 Tax=Halomonas campaniensis TaxID=213554 RepID=A0A7W5JZU3_9GAMM|nr:mechanosensitive ion channel domain-containing protein [Halomonas campaniensis]MBB3329355.1 small-conductance mechanosensitive channel [Halomonas campaniensis]